MAAIAASIQKSPCQPVASTSTPPMSGPAAAPAADAAPQSVIAFICPEPDASTERRLMPHARIVEPAAPWIMRPAITPAPLSTSAIRMHEATKRKRPARKTRRRPSTSPSAPAVTITAAPTSMYPVTAHWSWSIGAPRSLLIAGSRIVTAEVLAFTTNADTHAAARTPAPALRSVASSELVSAIVCSHVAANPIPRRHGHFPSPSPGRVRCDRSSPVRRGGTWA